MYTITFCCSISWKMRETVLGGKNGREAKSVGGHVGHGWCNK